MLLLLLALTWLLFKLLLLLIPEGLTVELKAELLTFEDINGDGEAIPDETLVTPEIAEEGLVSRRLLPWPPDKRSYLNPDDRAGWIMVSP